MMKQGEKMVFDWDDKYSVGDELIDSEHKHLFELGEEAFSFAESDKKVEKIRHIVPELYKYMKTHFENEEKYMAKIQYPNLEVHKQHHKDIIHTMNKFLKSVPTMSVNTIEHELASSVKHWILAHIEQEDKQIGEWLRAHPRA